MKAPEVISALTGTLLSGDSLQEQSAHSIGIETGLRFAFRHPEYGRALLVLVDEDLIDADAGRLAAERAIDGLVELCPMESIAESQKDRKAT